MDKEKILERIREEHDDEGLSHAESQGLKLGYKIFIVLNIFFIIFNMLCGQNSYAVKSLFCGFIAADAYSKYKFSNEKREKFTIIASAIACVLFLINHILYAFRL